MPEGPEIRRTADRLAEALVGRRLQRVVFHLPAPAGSESRLAGARVVAVKARSKALLTRFDNGFTLYSHNQLYGRWEIHAGSTLPPSRRQVRVVLQVRDRMAVLYSATEIALLDEAGLADHPYLSSLGPELLEETTDEALVLARLSDPRWRRRALMGLLQDQKVLAGMGNYLCCEALHKVGVHPRQRPADLSPQRLRRLAGACLALTRQSYATGGITNELQRAEALARQGAGFEERRFMVYRRAGRPCYGCGTPIVKARIGGQPAFFCPRCQKERSRPDGRDR